MASFQEIFLWLLSIFAYASQAVSWLTTEIKIGTESITPLGLLTISGLAALIPVSILKWFL